MMITLSSHKSKVGNFFISFFLAFFLRSNHNCNGRMIVATSTGYRELIRTLTNDMAITHNHHVKAQVNHGWWKINLYIYIFVWWSWIEWWWFTWWKEFFLCGKNVQFLIMICIILIMISNVCFATMIYRIHIP